MEKWGDFFSSIILVALSIGYLIYATNYNWGSLADPGPGFLPRITGILLLLLSLRLALSALPARSRSVAKETSVAAEENSEQSSMRPLLMVVALALYILILEWIGYLLSSFFLLLAGIKIIGERSWFKPLLITIGLGLFTYLLFGLWLEVPLPQGHLIHVGGRW